MSLPSDASTTETESRTRGALQLLALVALLVMVPLGIRLAVARHAEAAAAPSYLSALEGPRARHPFDGSRIPELQRLNPGYVVIGDSMAGTRIDEGRLGELAGRPVAPLLQAGSGSAFWYLALKNWVIASGIRPRCVFIFFRDTNLTDVMFRLDEQFRWSVDMVAGEREDEVNAAIASRTEGPWYRLHSLVDRLYEADRARRWLEPAVTSWPAEVLIRSKRRRTEFLKETNTRFGLEHLRPMEAADIQASADRDADFDRYVNRSVLPLMIRDAKRAGVPLCFVRVQRRPVGDRPPEQSPALRRYVAKLDAYIRANGEYFRDDTGDPALTLDMYEDGDHIAREARRRYTEIFFERLQPIFR
jgi:hypothetical protein